MLNPALIFLRLYDFAEFLLRRAKVDLSLLDKNKNTALHLACSKVSLAEGTRP